MHNLSPRDVCLTCEEYVFVFQFCDDTRMPFDLVVEDTLAINHLAHLNQIGGSAFKAHDCVPWAHIVLQPIELDSALHT